MRPNGMSAQYRFPSRSNEGPTSHDVPAAIAFERGGLPLVCFFATHGESFVGLCSSRGSSTNTSVETGVGGA